MMEAKAHFRMTRLWTRLIKRRNPPNVAPGSDAEWRSFPRRHPILIGTVSALFLLALGTVGAVYLHYAKLIDHKLGDGTMRTNSTIYAAPKLIAAGDTLSASDLISRLQGAGYTDQQTNIVGWYRPVSDGVEIHTGPASYFRPNAAKVTLAGGKIKSIYSKTENKTVDRYWLEPELVTNLSDQNRGKRRPVAFSELPRDLVNALVAVEDKRFFNHAGLDLVRMAKAVYVDLKERRKEQGASTLTMQLARSFWLDQDKTIKRKLAEIFLTTELERRFTKQQILELYTNEVYLGQRGSFSIHGFGEAARAYLGKDVRDLTLPESAMLVGIIQRPGYFNPFRYPQRVKERRDLALTLMHNNGYIDAQQLAAATAIPLRLSPGETESTDAPYFADLINDDLQKRFEDWDFATNAYRVYSTLDLDLQRIAVDAVKSGMAEVDRALQRLRGKKKDGPYPQVAVVVLDPHTGAVKALVGGRSYAQTQLNRAEAKRQPGSAFKPLVYAAALNGATQKKAAYVTAATPFLDEPTTFRFKNEIYEPTNFHDAYYGNVTMRQALAKSMNIPTIKMAEKVGYKTVADLARSAGLGSVQATPSLALGAYEVTPLELAEAYTTFTNNGSHVRHTFISLIKDRKNNTVFTAKPEQNQVIDPRVAYIMVDLMSEVVRSGTGAGIRSRGFNLPAAGKTGTSRDGWFVGFTSNLLCAVWVGYDDNSELELEGAKSAMPVWVEFMKKAHQLRQYADPQPFKMPDGLVRATIDPTTGGLATIYCPSPKTELFITGTQPKEDCTEHTEFNEADEGEKPNVFERVLGIFR